MNIKKLVAREGLILLSILLTSGALFVLGEYLHDKIQSDKIKTAIANAPSAQEDLSSYSNEELIKIVVFTVEEIKALKALDNYREKYSKEKGLDNLTLATQLANQYTEYQDILTNSKTADKKIRGETKRIINIDEFAATPPQKGINLNSISSAMTFCSFYLFILGYPIYLSIHFVLWAIKTLKTTAS
jgi:hypothetical protein